ncbi:MAG: hypothetical protein WCO66_01840 [Candidatus Absconditabacteria bacterium]
MSTSKETKLQEIASFEDRKAILRMLGEGKNLEQIGFPFEEKGGKDFVFSVVKALLTPDEEEPKFYIDRKEFSDSGFKAALAFLKCHILDGDFTPEQAEAIHNADISTYLELITHPNPPIPKEELIMFFELSLQHKISLPVKISAEQLKLAEAA